MGYVSPLLAACQDKRRTDYSGEAIDSIVGLRFPKPDSPRIRGNKDVGHASGRRVARGKRVGELGIESHTLMLCVAPEAGFEEHELSKDESLFLHYF